jgi:hypothetical protein
MYIYILLGNMDIPSALRRDNAKSEMSQRVKDIHRDLIISDQWTEPRNSGQILMN